MRNKHKLENNLKEKTKAIENPNTSNENQPSENITFKCTVCQLTRDTKKKLETHMKMHDEDSTWLCDTCDFQSSEKASLENHIK